MISEVDCHECHPELHDLCKCTRRCDRHQRIENERYQAERKRLQSEETPHQPGL